MLLVRAITALLIFSVVTACGKSSVELISDISEIDANEIIAALHSSGIDATKHKLKDNSSVTIESAHMANAVNILKAQGLPSQKHTTLGSVFEKKGMISTPLEEKARYIYALSQELEKTISQIDGVLIARVHLVLSEDNSIGDQTQKPSAAVFIKHLPILDPDTVSHKIQRILIRSVPGLTHENPEEVDISFIESVAPQLSIEWVEYMGLRITAESAIELRKKIVTALIVLLSTAGALACFYYIKKSKRENDSSTISV